MSAVDRPTFGKLEREECLEILKRNHIGRLAYARKNHIDIEPVHYVYADGWLYGRTSHGRKLEMTGYEWWPVAFEVDEVEALFSWRSVVVRGGFYVLPSDGAGKEVEEWNRAVEVLRTLIPETLTEADPAPDRTVLFRIAAQDVNGREARPAGRVEEAGG